MASPKKKVITLTIETSTIDLKKALAIGVLATEKLEDLAHEHSTTKVTAVAVK